MGRYIFTNNKKSIEIFTLLGTQDNSFTPFIKSKKNNKMNLKQYKLIKAYPNSLSVDTIFIENELDPCEFIPNGNRKKAIGLNLIKQFSEHFEEIDKNLEYEVLTLRYILKNEFHHILCSWDKGEDNFSYSKPMKDSYNFLNDYNYNNREVWFKTFLNTGNWEIYSIKRVSDEEVFTIGDNCEDGLIENFSITTKIGYSTIYTIVAEFKVLNLGNTTRDLSFLKKVTPKPIVNFEIETFIYIGDDDYKGALCSWDIKQNHVNVLHKYYDTPVSEKKIFKKKDEWVNLFLEIIESKKLWAIHSIKRKSDGEVFSTGDYVRLPHWKEEGDTYLSGFKLKGEDLCFLVTEDDDNTATGAYLNIDKFEKYTKEKEPVFITEDGVKKFDGDSFVAVNTNGIEGEKFNIRSKFYLINIQEDSSEKFGQELARKNGILWFSTEEAANKFIDSKVILTTEDDVKIFDDKARVYLVHKNTCVFQKSGFNDLFEINFASIYKEQYVIFSKKEAALKYVFDNKPCLSINEVYNRLKGAFTNVTYLRALLEELTVNKQ